MNSTFAKVKISSVIAVLILLSSCDSNTIFKQYDDDFPQSQWLKTDIRSYEFDIKSEGTYDLEIIFSHIYDTPLENIPVMVQFEPASGEVEKMDVVMRLRDENGKHIGDCAGDYCDLKYNVFKNRKLAVGKYKITLAHQFDYQTMPNVLGVGIEVIKSKNQ